MTDAATCPYSGKPLNELTLTDPLIQAQPTEFYARMRAEDPVHFDEKLGMWLVTRYDDIVELLRDPETFSDKHGYEKQYASGYFEEFKQILETEGGGFFSDAIKSDPPYHTRIRKLLDKAFTAHRVKSLEPGITKVISNAADKLMEKAANGEVVDGVREYAIPLTIAVICEQMGIEQYNGEKISRWSEAITAQIGRMQDHDQMVANAKEICDLQNFIIAQMKDREANPKEDMISDLVHATTEDGEKLTFAEAVSLIRALIIAGNDTTATAIGNLMFILASKPDLADELYNNMDDRRYMNRFVEELLRYAPPVRGLAKMTTRECELGGQKLPKGAHMLVMYASGNDDDSKFECPREFSTERPNHGSHLAFGVGIHRCVGASLARMEINVAAKELIKRAKRLHLQVAPEDLTYQPTVATHTIAKLPLTLEPRS
ncbi:cytochrome P450 [Litorivivens sp.]|uniref:cytochrome P450 n=2 Tax=Litorivivens sp. TaxID=2020868 RepID=UPI00356B1315